MTARSIEFDAIVVAGGAPTDNDVKAVVLVGFACRGHGHLAWWGFSGAGAGDRAPTIRW